MRSTQQNNFSVLYSEIQIYDTVNIQIFVQYIFLPISHRTLIARKYDVNKKNIRVKIEVIARCVKIYPCENATKD